MPSFPSIPSLDTVRDTVKSYADKGSTYLRNLSKKPGSLSANGAGNGKFYFPADVEKYPRMCIESKNKKIPLTVFLQMPQALAVGDSLAYGSMNLGQIGKAGQEALNKIQNGDLNLKSIGEAAVSTAEGVAGQVRGIGNNTVRAAALAQIANKAGLVPSGIITAAAEAAMYNQRSVLNPNQVTTFNGSNTRSFTFNFKLVGTTAAENVTIRDMVDGFRLNAYPAGNDIVLEYPSEFTITFLKEGRGGVNDYISPIFNCFLMSISTTYNSTANSFYEDGAPLEVDISLSFQETKALTRDDLKAMKTGIRKDPRSM